jgi:sulfoxide reductase heme-binding subunit YedZ
MSAPRAMGIWIATCVGLAAVTAMALCVGRPFLLERGTGWFALALAIATLTATPLARALRSRPTLAVAVQRARRPLGLTTAAAAMVHAGISLFRYLGDDALAHLDVLFTLPWLTQGTLALLLFALLALTSWPPIARRARAWTSLHRSIYVAALLAASHALLGPHSSDAPLVALALIALLLVLRLVPHRVPRRVAVVASSDG